MDAATKLLVLSVEDFTGIWDAVLELADEGQGSDRDASKILRELVDAGLVQLYRGEGPDAPDLKAVASEDVNRILGPGTHWSVPTDGATGPFVYLAATKAGADRVRVLNWGHGS